MGLFSNKPKKKPEGNLEGPSNPAGNGAKHSSFSPEKYKALTDYRIGDAPVVDKRSETQFGGNNV